MRRPRSTPSARWSKHSAVAARRPSAHWRRFCQGTTTARSNSSAGIFTEGHAATYGETLEIRLTVAELGRTSFRYEYEIVDGEDRTVVMAKTVQVMYDYTAGKPVPIPDEIRALLTLHTKSV